jgi:hypothetical protein
MKKTDILSFIGRYHLAGATTSVKWVSQDGKLTTRFITDDQNVIGSVTSETLNVGDHELGVFATPQLVKMLSAVNDDIDVDVNVTSNHAVSLGINDKDVNMTFMLADLSVIRQVPELKQLPDWNVTVTLNKEFVNRFIKAKNALPEAENFGIACNSGKVEFIMNYSSINKNRIKFEADCEGETCKDMSVICFSSNLFKEILQANRDADTATLEVSGAGLARVTFKSQTYESLYYLVQLQTA